MQEERSNPPKWPARILKWFCAEEHIEILQGDLQELYEYRLATKGRRKARLHYIKDSFDMLRGFAFKKKKSKLKNNVFTMFKVNFKTSFRMLMKQRVNSLINISGLSLGIAICLLMAIYVNHEFQYDKFQTEYDRIYRVTSNWGSFPNRASTALPAGPALKADIPLIEESIRYMSVLTNDNSGIPVKYQNRKFAEEGFVCVDKAFLEMFNIEIVLGNAATALDNPNNVLLNEEMVTKYFGSTNPIGQVLKVEDQFDMIVTGVFRSINHKSHMYFDFLAPMSFMEGNRWGTYTFTQNWSNTFGYTYVKLSENTTAEQTEALLPQFVANHYPDKFGEDLGDFSLKLQPLEDIHLKSNYDEEIRENGEIRLIVQMVIIALVILIIAIINFVNLATARSTLRGKEVGIRKAMGALRGQLIKQFLMESFLISAAALILAFGLVIIFLPYFNSLMQREFLLSPNLIGQLTLFGAGLMLLISLLAGTYPAIALSGFQPVKALKSHLPTGLKGSSVRKVFTAIQFAASLTFLIGIYVIYDQLNYIKTKEVGMTTSELLLINRPPQSITNDVIIGALEKVSAVSEITTAAGSIPGYKLAKWSYHPEGFPRERRSFFTMWGYNDVAATFGFEMLAGEDFSRVNERDSINSLILNESAVRDLGWTNEEAIGKSFGEFHWRQDTITSGRVVGVIKDFHFESLHEPLKPMVIIYTSNDFGNLVVKLNQQAGSNTISNLEKAWNQFLPDLPFTINFLDNKIAAQYQQEERLRESISYFAFIAIFTSALGLLGLVSFVLAQRSKEIGIRKILGAPIAVLIKTLSADFLKLIGIAFLLAAPLGYYLMNIWLSDFEFAVKIGMNPFLFALGVITTICMVTVGLKSFKAATINPIEILRDE